jgi:hypothetical protein
MPAITKTTKTAAGNGKATAKAVAAQAKTLAAKAVKEVQTGNGKLTAEDVIGAALLAKPKAKAKPARAKDADTIVTVQTADRGRASQNKDPKIVAAAEDGTTVMINTSKLTKDLNRLLVVGGSLAALNAAIAALPTPKLARGVTEHDAPHAAKSVQDAKSKAPTPAKAATTKAPKIAKAAPTDVPATTTITATAKGQAKIAKVGPADRLAVMVAAGTVGAAITKMTMADIRYAAKCNLITLG